MDKKSEDRSPGRVIAGVLSFLLVFVAVMVVATMNAPTMGGPKVMSSLQSYLAEVKRSALPFLAVIAVAAAVVAFLIGRMVYRIWPNKRKRSEMLTAYGFLSPYLIITLIFTVGVILFAFYISFTDYDIFTSPEWVGLENYATAFRGFSDPTQKDFIQSLYNVFWYALIVIPAQTGLAIWLASLLNNSDRFRQFFRTIFYAPSVTSSVVITLIFMWFFLKTGYINFFFDKIFSLFGGKWEGVLWLGDPRGLIQLIVTALGGNIPSDQWYLRGPSIAWMSIMFQNIFTTAPTFMIMFLAAMQDINPALYEAAALDGATKRQQFRQITLPLLKPITLMVIVLGTIGTLQIFDQVYLATSGGPLGTSLTPVFLIYREAMGQQGPIRMGYAAALAFILGAIIFVLTYFQRHFLERGTEQY